MSAEDLKKSVPPEVWKVAAWLFGAAFAVLTGYIALWMDARNDKRYVQIEAYRSDRERDREMGSLVNGQINERLRAQDKKLDEIAGDVKTLLRESRK